ncbi:MAG: hypothetical protein R2787_06830 [Saprospiraceae bacterium]
MRSTIFFILLFANTTCLLAQKYWSKTFEIAPAREQVWQMAHMNGEIIMSAIANCKGDGNACNVLVVLDTNGIILKSNVLSEEGFQFYPTGFPAFSRYGNSYLQSFLTDYYTGTLSSYLFYLDTSGLTIDSAFLTNPITYELYNVQGHIQLSNKSTLEYGQEYNPVTKQSLSSLYYRNPNGKLVWERNIGDAYNFNLIGSSICEMTPNKIVGISQSCTGCEYPTMKPYVFAVDTLGNLVLDLYLDTMISNFTNGQRPLIAPYDSTSFVIVWYQQNKNGFDNNPYIARIKEDGSIIWRTLLPILDPGSDFRWVNQVIRARNGDYIIAGERIPIHIMPGSGLTAIGCALRISPEGKVIWDRVYHEPDVKFPKRQFFWNVAEDEAENLYFSGEVEDSVVNEISEDRNKNFWLVKVGPDGCIEPGCSEQVILLPTEETFRILPDEYLQVFPNPVSDVLHLSWEELPAGTANLSAHDISGRLLGSWPISGASGSLSLDTRSWPAGIALLSLRSDHWMTLPMKVVVE